MGIEVINIVIGEILTSQNPTVISTTLHGLDINNPLNEEKNRGVDSDEEEGDVKDKKCPTCANGLSTPNDQMLQFIQKVKKDIIDSKELKNFPAQEYFNSSSVLFDFLRQFILVWRPHLLILGGLASLRCATDNCPGISYFLVLVAFFIFSFAPILSVNLIIYFFIAQDIDAMQNQRKLDQQ
jgi:hypothetical protein